MSSRRRVLQFSSAGALLSICAPRLLQAQTGSRPPRADQVMWGGLGFSVPNADVLRAFPMTSRALSSVGGLSKLALGFTSQLGMNYRGGVAEDPMKLIDANSDPALLFAISIDFEQMILVPNDGAKADFQLSFLYALAQVLYLDLPRQGGSDGDLRVLYSFPFRVQSGDTAGLGMEKDRVENFRKLLFDVDNSLVNFFGKKVATKRFKEARVPKRLKVMSVSITPEALTAVKELGIQESLTTQFFGQAMTASLAERAELSVLPFSQNDVLTGALASRFTKFPNISKMFGRLNDPLENNYTIDLTIHRVLRKSNGANIANILYARGMSIFVKVTDVYKKSTVFEKKILLIENNELPKAMFDRLKDYDLRYMVQITIKMFDLFAEAVMTESTDKMKQIGMDPVADLKDVKALKEVLLSCRY